MTEPDRHLDGAPRAASITTVRIDRLDVETHLRQAGLSDEDVAALRSRLVG
jgi:hypothetical protein